MPADLVVHAGQDAIEELDHQDLGAEPPPDRAELETDHPGAHDEKFPGHLVEHERAGRGHDALLVDLDALEARNVRAGGDDDGFRFQRLGLAVGGFHLDLAGRHDAADALNAIDLVLLEEIGDALDVAVDAFVLELHHGGEVERGLADLDAHAGELMPGLFKQFGGVQQRLRRNAADVEAGAAEGLVLLDHRDLHAELRRADGADVAAGTGADDDEVVGHGDLWKLKLASASCSTFKSDENTCDRQSISCPISSGHEGVAVLAAATVLK